MDAGKIIETIAKLMETAATVIPEGMKTADEMRPFAVLVYDHLVNKKVISDVDIAMINQKCAELSARIQAPIPPEQDDDI